MSIERRKRYSERNGYKSISETIILRSIPLTLQNSLCSSFDRLYKYSRYNMNGESSYWDLQRYLWTHYLNSREGEYSYGANVIINYLKNSSYKWYEKFDIIEEALYFLLHKMTPTFYRNNGFTFLKNDLNSEFERLNVGHRVVDEYIVDVISDSEIASIEAAVSQSADPVKEHFQNALMLYAKRPDADYRNSIKESISALESYCRIKTGEATLGKALKKLENAGITIHPRLKSAFEQLYAYTNDGDTGIRHALIEGDAVPTNAEAMFMLVSCTALVNYLNTQHPK